MLAAADRIVPATDHSLLSQHGGSLVLTTSWASQHGGSLVLTTSWAKSLCVQMVSVRCKVSTSAKLYELGK